MTGLAFLLILFTVPLLHAEISDPFNPFEKDSDITTDEQGDREKSARQLILEATVLLYDDRLLDARTKLLRALQREPEEYRTHTMLSAYYLDHVGHFRLSLKYVKRAMELFYRQEGYPPYDDFLKRNAHEQLLYLLSQVRLNLDDYEGSLQVLDEFTSYGYTSAWYPGSRAWVLMKLGRIEEAIKVARTGVLEAAEPGRTMNMLGILLSMNGERESSLAVFREAIAYELSQGREGQPATPLNNSGEVYKEMFLEREAERSWLRATSLPDGCEHVLPSLNLVILYIEEFNLAGAKRAVDSFEACIAQYPLRNGEEHKALVALARGRIALHAGQLRDAEKLLEESLQKRQWFGKIGTSLEDLEAALYSSIAQLRIRQNNHLATAKHDSIIQYLGSLKTRAYNRIRAWWYFRKARQVLAEDLSDIEDLYIRNTDSLLEYSTLGEVLAGYPTGLLKKRIEEEEKKDGRMQAVPYYRIYLAENYLQRGRKTEGLVLLRSGLATLRQSEDVLLFVHATALLLRTLDPYSAEYAALTRKIMGIAPAELRNYGHPLPVVLQQTPDESIEDAVNGSAFLPAAVPGIRFTIVSDRTDKGYRLRFLSQDSKVEERTVTGTNPVDAVNKLSDAVFSEKVE